MSRTVGAFIAYLELYLRFVNRGFRVPQMINSIQGGAAAYARLRPLLAPPLPLANEPPGASFRADHIAGMQEPAPVPPSVPTGPGRSHCTGHLPLLDRHCSVTTSGWTFRLAPWSRSQDPLAGKSAWLGPAGPVSSEAGQVLLDGRPLEDMPVAERAARTGYLPQDPYLFSGTTATTSCWARPPCVRRRTMPHCRGRSPGAGSGRVLRRLGEDLRTFPAGLETEIGELGIRVSGGQRQRIALARAMVTSGTLAPGLRSPGRSVLGPGPGYGSQDRRWLAPALRPVAAIRPAVHGRAVLAPPAGLSPG